MEFHRSACQGEQRSCKPGAMPDGGRADCLPARKPLLHGLPLVAGMAKRGAPIVRVATDRAAPVARRMRRVLSRESVLGVAALWIALALCARGAIALDAREPLAAPLTKPPLTGALGLNGGFGEYRIGHFHAGVDLSTGGRVGKPVYAPLSGWVERVRASGVGYGRSIYIHSTDGRLLQLGHLDAFVEPMAYYVAAAQESSGQYEQDLWPDPGRFRVRAGQQVAWSGESGAGGPHVHFEIRRGDMAYHPLRAGLAIPDTRPPTLASLTLEPLDDTSFVARGAAPFTLALAARPETLVVEGRVRAIVGARDGLWSGVDRMVPWSVGMVWEGLHTECRFDSISWASDMPEGDYVYDAGRVVGEKGLVLWAPPGWRPRVMVAEAPLAEAAGTIVVGAGAPPRPLALTARDLGGGLAERTVMLRGPRPGERGIDTTSVAGRATPPAEDRFRFAALPGGFWRVTYRGAPRGSRAVRWGDADTAQRAGAVRGGEDWSVVVNVARERLGHAWWFEGRGPDGRPWRDAGPVMQIGQASGAGAGPVPMTWSAAADARFEPGPIGLWLAPLPRFANEELVPIAALARLEPETLPLRKAVTLGFGSERLEPGSHAGLYRFSSDGWEWIATRHATNGPRVEAEVRRLGSFALFADTLAPRITPLAAARRAVRGPYSRWALEARIEENGSGLDPRQSYVRIDGKRRPAEWDSEQGVLRWRPSSAPVKGAHRFEFVATDRAGNTRERGGRFVID